MKRSTLQKNALLTELEKQVELHLKDAVSTFQNMSTELLLKKSDTGGWSIAECFDHLNSYSYYYLPQFKKGLEKQKGKPTSETFRSSWLGSYFTRIMQHPDTSKKKYSAFKNHVPKPNLDAHKVIAIFIEQQETLLDCIKEARSSDLNKIKIPLSIARWVTFKLGDAFQFLIAHTERHIRQAKRNI